MGRSWAMAAALSAVVVGLGLASCSSSRINPGGPDRTAPIPTAATPSASPPVHWASCNGTDGPKGFQCASIPVPRDPQDPSLGTISMALDRKPATGSAGQRVGSLLTNPGGPGVSGVDALPSIVASMPSSLLQHFDVVGFDPPGVGGTAPIVCLSSSRLAAYFHVDPAPTTTSGFDNLVASERSFASGCEAMSGPELPYVSTVDAAMDMDVIRQDVGDAKLTYLGFSYGTFLGATYASLFPTHIRAMVLDGALDPAIPVIPELDEQSAGLYGEMQQFMTQCASSSSCPWRPGSSPSAAYSALLARVTSSPLPVPGSTRTVGPAELIYGTAAALYSTSTWPFLEQALAHATGGNGADLLELFDAYTERNPNGSYNNLFEANAAINCLDDPAPTLVQLQFAAATAEREAPWFGLANLDSEAGCSVWPVAATGQVGPIHASGSPQILVVGSTGDPVTPYAWAQALAGELAHGVLLTRVGDGHTAYEFSSCIRTNVDAYLTSLTVPPVGTRCASD